MYLKLNLIAAACENMGIGKNNNLPWRLKKEMEYFTKMTTKTENPHKKNVVIMGRKTWDSIPKKYKPLNNRVNFVLSRSELNVHPFEETYHFKSMDECIAKLNDKDFKNFYENVWVVGGSHIYMEAMKSKYLYRIYLTKILKTFDCDTFFPELPQTLRKISDPDVPDEIQREGDLEYVFTVYENIEFEN